MWPKCTTSPERRQAQQRHDIGAIRELIRDTLGTACSPSGSRDQVIQLLTQIRDRFNRLHPPQSR